MLKFKVLLLFFSLLLLFSCQEEELLLSGDSINGSVLTASAIKDHLPPALFSRGYAVYENATGETRKLRTYDVSTNQEKRIGGYSYQGEDFEVRLYDETSENSLFLLSGTSHYVEDTASPGIFYTSHSLIASNLLDHEEWMICGRVVTEGKIVETNTSLPVGPKTYLGITFDHVGECRRPDHTLTDNNYNLLAIQADLGIVAFELENAELWVLSHYEEE